jgi:ankyrin repeat protein
MTNSTQLLDAIKSDDPSAVARVLEADPGLKSRLDEPLDGYGFGQTALMAAVHRANRDTIDVLLRAGANINQKSHWWAGPFHVLDSASQESGLASFLIDRGAVPEIHHLVRLGMMDEVRRALDQDPAVVRARGGDGQLPLHFAQTVEMAGFLLERGADVSARDIDHESTAAQYMVRDRQAVAQFLVSRGSETDILMASAFGDAGLVRRLLSADPDVVGTTVSDRWFPKRDSRAGGTIYIWTLGSYKGAHAIAREFGHEDVLDLLMNHSPDHLQLSIACELGDEARVRRLLAARPNIVQMLPAGERRKVADAATNNNTDAVRLMLKAGWPPDIRGQHNATALHWAGFHGNVEMARALVERGAPVDVKGDDYDGTPLGWTIHGSLHGWHCRTGDYAGTAQVLIDAGAHVPPLTPEVAASPAVLDVLRRHSAR